MLVLTRKNGEQIRIGADVVLTVIQIDRGKVRLGIEAPKEVNIVRVEIDDFRKEQEDGPPTQRPAG
jgi:carbon storage regulator